jgi:hypothetical protein
MVFILKNDTLVNIMTKEQIKFKIMKTSIQIMLLFFSLNLYAQQDKEILIPFLDGDKYGYANENGKMIIPARFETALPFFSPNELSMVEVNNKAMIINRKGKNVANASTDYFNQKADSSPNQLFVSHPEPISIDAYCLADSCPEFQIYSKFDSKFLFDKIGVFYFVRSGNKVFLIDHKGTIKSRQFDRIRHIRAGEIEYAITEDNAIKKKGLLNDKGEQLLECVYDGIAYKGKGLFDLTQNGKTYPYKMKYNENYQARELLKKKIYSNRIIRKHDGLYGLTDSMGSVLIPYKFKKLYPGQEDKYLYYNDVSVGIIEINSDFNFKLDLVKSNSETFKNQPFTPFVPYSENLSFFNDGETWNLVDFSGKILMVDLDGIFIDFQKVAANVAGISKKGKIGLIGSDGKIIFPTNYIKINIISDNNTFIVQNEDGWAWLDSQGLAIYSGFDEFGYILPGYLFIKKGGKWFFVNSKGKEFKK